MSAPLTHAGLLELLASNRLVALYLTMEGCGPCHAVRPWAEALFGDAAWTWVPVDTAQSPEIAGQLLVFSHPTLLLFAEGREQARFSRVVPRAPVERAKAMLEAGP